MLSDPETIEALALSSQAIRPAKWVIGKFTAAVEQVDTIAVNTLTVSHVYAFTINGTIITYTSASSGDTQQSILSSLLTAIGTAFPTNLFLTLAVTGLRIRRIANADFNDSGRCVSVTLQSELS